MFASIPLGYKNPGACMRVSVIFLSYGLGEKIRISIARYMKFCSIWLGMDTVSIFDVGIGVRTFCLAQDWHGTIVLKLKLFLAAFFLLWGNLKFSNFLILIRFPILKVAFCGDRAKKESY